MNKSKEERKQHDQKMDAILNEMRDEQMAWFGWTDGMGKYVALGEYILELTDQTNPTTLGSSTRESPSPRLEEGSQYLADTADEPEGWLAMTITIQNEIQLWFDKKRHGRSPVWGLWQQAGNREGSTGQGSSQIHVELP